MKMSSIAKSLNQTPKTPNIKELLTNQETALNFAALMEAEMNNMATGAAAAGGGAPVGQLEHLQSLVLKLNTIAQREKGDPEVAPLSVDEQQQLIPFMGKYQRGSEAIRSGEKFMSSEDIETITRAAALHPDQIEIAGILALDDSRSRDRVSRAFKAFAFIDPDRYTATVNNLSSARNFLKSDWKVLSPLFQQAEKYGIDKTTVMAALDHDDWRARLINSASARVQGKSRILSGIRQIGIQKELGLFSALVDRYRSHNPERARFTAELGVALREIFMQEGVVGSMLTREALAPDAPPETKQAHQGMKTIQAEMNTLMNNKSAFDADARSRLSRGDPHLWSNRADPAVSEHLAADWLEGNYRERINTLNDGGMRGSIWSRLWEFLSSLFGTAYNGADVSKVASQIRGL